MATVFISLIDSTPPINVADSIGGTKTVPRPATQFQKQSRFIPSQQINSRNRFSPLQDESDSQQVFHKRDLELTKTLQEMIKKLTSIETRKESLEKKIKQLGSNSHKGICYDLASLKHINKHYFLIKIDVNISEP